MKKEKNYKLRSKVQKGLGTTTWITSTFGGFFAYQFFIDWENFKNQLDNFIVLNEQSVKINLFIAFPMLVSIMVFIWIYVKKNQEALKGKMSLNVLVLLIIFWLIYSIIEATLFALMGAFVGLVIDEFVFTPLSNNNKLKAGEQKELKLEVKKEKIRKQVRDDIDGTV